MATPYLSVIIPCYNGAGVLPTTLIAVDKFLSAKEYPYEILVVNDGSRDRTAEVAASMTAAIKNLKVINNPVNQGKGGVVRQGMLVARGAYRLFMDDDNSTDISHIDRMLPYFSAKGGSLPDRQAGASGGEQGYHVVIGSRAVAGARLEPPEPPYRQLLGKAGNLLIQLTNVPGIWDTQCGFKVFTAEAAEHIFPYLKIKRWGFDVEVLALARKLGYRIKEVPVRWVNNLNSRIGLSAYLQVFVENFKIRWWLWTGAYGNLV
jgi:dolichyl-phosphate beta-glucosyltransferase